MKSVPVDALIAALEFYAAPENWWNTNVDDPFKFHNANLNGSMERISARVGTVVERPGFVHTQFYNDCGDRAGAALATYYAMKAEDEGR